MKTWRIVSGIISMLMLPGTLATSTLHGMGAALAGGMTNSSAEYGGEIMIFRTIAAFILFATGVVSIANKELNNKTGNIAILVLFGFVGLINICYSGILVAMWCIINLILNGIILYQRH